MIKKTIKDCDKILLIISLILLVFGLFNIVTVSSQEVTNKLIGKSIYYYFRKIFYILPLFADDELQHTRPSFVK